MRKALIYLAIPALLAGCHRGGSDSLQRQQQQYDTVQEGQSSTVVTSTITAPGEVAPKAGMTGTNSDTTTNFTLPQVSSTTSTQNQPGTLAGTLTVPSNSGPMVGYPSNPPQKVRPKPRPPVVAKAEPAKTDTVTTDVKAPPPSTSTTPPTTDTAPPPPSDTQPPPTTTTG